MDFDYVFNYLLKEPLEHGLVVQVSKEKDTYVIDLNTQAKSGCYLRIDQKSGLTAHRRYGRVDNVENYEDLLRLIAGCGHGRDYFSSVWLEVLKKHGYIGVV